MNYLENKTALVTGASSGIGYEIVKYISKFNMKIIVTARRENNLNQLKKEVRIVRMLGIKMIGRRTMEI